MVIADSNARLLRATLFFLRLSSVATAIGALFAIGVLGASLAGAEGMQYSKKLATLDPEDARRYTILFSAAGVLGLGCVAMALRNLLQIVRSARDGDPFILENGQRLRRVGVLIVVMNVVFGIAVMLSGLWLHADRTEREPALTFGFPFSTLLMVLLIFVLASIFEQGARMRAELQATI